MHPASCIIFAADAPDLERRTDVGVKSFSLVCLLKLKIEKYIHGKNK